MKRMNSKTTAARSRMCRRAKMALLDYVTLMDKIMMAKAKSLALPSSESVSEEVDALRNENRRLRRRCRPRVIKIENVNINTVVNKQ